MADEAFEYFDVVPSSRSYVHVRCETVTTVADNEEGEEDEQGLNPKPHTGLSDPTGSPTAQTFCVGCEDVFSIEEFVWEDTGEKLSEFRQRWRRKMSPVARLVCSSTFVIGALIAVLLATLALAALSIVTWGLGLLGIAAALAAIVLCPVVGILVAGAMMSRAQRNVFGAEDYRQLK